MNSSFSEHNSYIKKRLVLLLIFLILDIDEIASEIEGLLSGGVHNWRRKTIDELSRGIFFCILFMIFHQAVLFNIPRCFLNRVTLKKKLPF